MVELTDEEATMILPEIRYFQFIPKEKVKIWKVYKKKDEIEMKEKEMKPGERGRGEVK